MFLNLEASWQIASGIDIYSMALEAIDLMQRHREGPPTTASLNCL